jgi:long-chain fatty acid transport protein
MYSSGTISPVPTGYVTINPGRLLWDRVAFGVGMDSPFGLNNKYDSNDPAVHYTGWRNYLKMFTVKPVMAIQFFDWLSIGGGPMYYRIYDFGTILAYPNQLLGFPFPDGQLRLNTSGNSWGWQLGVLLKPHKKHQFGFYFRSPVHLKLKGQIKVENATIGGNFETGAYTKLNLPLNFTWAYAFKPNDRTTIEADFGFTRWSIFKRLYINADPVNPFDDAILAALGRVDTDYRNGFSLQLGGNHQLTKKLTLRGGSWFFWTPVPKTHFRPAVPDSNRLGFSLGASYEVFKHLLFDAAYSNVFVLRRNVDNNLSEVLGTTVDGKYFSYIQEFVFSFTYQWDNFFEKFGIGPKSSLTNNTHPKELA